MKVDERELHDPVRLTKTFAGSRQSLEGIRAPRTVFLIVLGVFLFLLVAASAVQAAFVMRYTTIANGGMTFTGNTLGLSKAANANAPGTSGSIGAFIASRNPTSVDGTYPAPTTSDWRLNASAAQLRLPVGSTVLYAELIWGGSFRYGGEDVSASLNNAVTFSGPGGTFSVSPSPSTAFTTGSGENYYVRSADVTSMVQAGGAGIYTVGGVPGTQGSSENNANAAGWTLAVIYGHPALPARNMTIFVGAALTSTEVSTTSSVRGFCTPGSGTIRARMMVAAIEGDSNITGDQMRFGPTAGTVAAVSGPNNPINNFFASQINQDNGTLDTAGTFGAQNHAPGSNSSGRRQGWDITNVDVSARMQPGQSTAFAQGTTTGDRYTIASIGLQIDVGAPVFPSAVLSVDKTQTHIGDILTYSATLDNTAGSADALNVLFTSAPPAGTSFVPNSFRINGVVRAGADPAVGVNLGTILAGTTISVSFQVQVVSIPPPPAPATFAGQASWTYEYQSCAGFPINNGILSTNVVSTGTPRLQPTKSASPAGAVLPGGVVTYTVSIPNTGTANSSGTTLVDPIPAGTTYVPNSTTLNGIAVADVGGAMPFAVVRLVNSPGGAAGQIRMGETATLVFRVTIDPNPPLIITNIATIDPDGPGPAPAITVPVTNPPVRADLAVTVTDNQTSVVAGTPATYAVTVTNNGPDSVISLNLSVPLPAAILNPIRTASAGTYDPATGGWTGLNLAAGGSATLTITGLISPSATGNLTVTATVSPPPGVEDANMANNFASDTNNLTFQADLAIAITDGTSSVIPGTEITYIITVTNNGPSRIQGLTVAALLPSALVTPVFMPSQGVYNETDGVWTGVNLLPGGALTLTLRATVSSVFKGILTTGVTVSPPSGVTDPVPGNNSATDVNTTTPAISIVKSVNKTTALPGEELTFSVRFWNQGGGYAKNLVIMDTVPLNTRFVPGSLRMGNAGGTYATATAKTDAVGDDEAEINGDNIVFRISDVAPDDGVANSGLDEGVVYFRVTVR